MRLLMGVVLALCACGGVRYTSSTTRGVGCNDFAEAFCDRAIDCSFITTSQRTACLDGIQGGCCADTGVCGERIYNATGAANCVNSIPTEECSALGSVAGGPVLPAYCRQMF